MILPVCDLICMRVDRKRFVFTSFHTRPQLLSVELQAIKQLLRQ